MMDAEDVEVAAVLVPGVAGAEPEDVSRYLGGAVVPTDETALAEEELGTIQQDLRDETAKGDKHSTRRAFLAFPAGDANLAIAEVGRLRVSADAARPAASCAPSRNPYSSSSSESRHVMPIKPREQIMMISTHGIEACS